MIQSEVVLCMITSYEDMIQALQENYPGYDITMGSTNVLKAPSIIINLTGVTTSSADDSFHSVTGANYAITFYVDDISSFDVRAAAMLFGNVAQIDFDGNANGEMFQSQLFIPGGKSLWGVIDNG